MQSERSAGNNPWVDGIIDHVVTAINRAPLPDGAESCTAASAAHGTFHVAVTTPGGISWEVDFRSTKADPYVVICGRRGR